VGVPWTSKNPQEFEGFKTKFGPFLSTVLIVSKKQHGSGVIKATASYGLGGWPHLVIVDKKGVVRYNFYNNPVKTVDKTAALIDKILNE